MRDTTSFGGAPGFARRPGPDTCAWYLGNLVTFLADGEHTAGRFSLLETNAPRGLDPPMHVHTHEDEAFYVLEGEFTFWVGEEVVPAPAGTFVWGPRGLPHTFQVQSEPAARMLVLMTPPGLERYFQQASEPARAIALPPPPADLPDLQAMVQELAGFGVQVVGPPPGL